MPKKQLLIVGDSFSSEQIAGQFGWPVLLKKDFCVTNLSQPGVGQYKILNQIKSVSLNRYDAIVVSHTSPNRLHTCENPLYPPEHVYRKSDIIFADAESKVKHNPIAHSIVDYFKYIFDQDYYNFIHDCCCEKIHQSTSSYPTLHITHFDWTGLYQFPNMINFYNCWLENKGNFSHYSQEGNKIVYQQLVGELTQKTK